MSSAPSRKAVLASRIAWLCLLAAFLGGQLVFWQDSSDPFAPVESFFLKLTLVLGALPFLAARKGALMEFMRSWPAKAGLAWVAWLWMAASFAPVAYHADAFKTAFEVSLYSLPFFVAAVATASERKALAMALLSGGLLAAAYGFLQHFNLDPWSWSTNFGGRPLGTIGNPDFFGGHLMLVWGPCLAGLLYAPQATRWRWGLATALTALVLLYTLTVGAWLGMAFSLAAWLIFVCTKPGTAALLNWGLSRRKLLQILLALAILAALAGASPWGRARWAHMKADKAASVVNREMMWKVALKLWRQAPIQGAGLCTYRPLYPQLQAEILNSEKTQGWNYVVTWLPHENYLYWLCETGLMGLGLFLFYWGACLGRGWRQALDGSKLALGAGLALVGLLGASFLNTFSNIAPTAVGSALCLGFLAGGPAAAAQQKDKAALGAPLEAWVLTLLLALGVGRAGGLELVANRLTRQAGRAEKISDFAGAAALSGKAGSLDIANFSQQAVVGVHFQQAEDLRKTGRLAEAVDAYQLDLKENPWAPEVQNMLGASQGQLGVMSRRGDLVAQGAEHLKTAAWVNPGYTTALVNLGGSYMTLGDLSGAAEAWTEVLQYEPQNQDALGYLQMLKRKK